MSLLVGMVFTPSSRSLGPVPATSASETARVITLLQSRSAVSEKRKAAGWWHTHTHNRTIQCVLWAMQLCSCAFQTNSSPLLGHPHNELRTNTTCIKICLFSVLFSADRNLCCPLQRFDSPSKIWCTIKGKWKVPASWWMTIQNKKINHQFHIKCCKVGNVVKACTLQYRLNYHYYVVNMKFLPYAVCTLRISHTDTTLQCPGFRWKIPSWQNFVLAWHSISTKTTTRCVNTIFMPVWHWLHPLLLHLCQGAHKIEGLSILNWSMLFGLCNHTVLKCDVLMQRRSTEAAG